MPAHDDLVDAGVLIVLGVLAIFEFHDTYAGWNFLVVTILGLVLGILIAHLANVLRQPAIVLAVMGLAAFFLLGGAVALRHAPGASFLPTGGTLHHLASGAIHGWRDLLTTVPPVDGAGPLLVLAYILGLFCGLGGFAVARRTRWAFWPLLAPLSVFVLVILLGSVAPSSTTLVACLFAVVSLVWVAVRNQRLRPVVASGSGAVARLVTAVALLGVAGIGAYLVGPHVPGSGSDDRVVLRKYVHPKVDIGDYPSPLAEYRLFAGDQKDTATKELTSLADQTLFTVSGLPANTPLRFATLDAYTGQVWAATTTGVEIGAKPDTFLRVGPTLDDPAPGPSYTMTVRVQRYDDYWLPEAGAVQGVEFTDADKVQQTQDFRYNLATSTGVVPGKLDSGASYTLRVAGVTPAVLTSDSVLADDGDTSVGAFLATTANSLAGAEGSRAAQVLKIGATLKQVGHYTHGDTATGFGYFLPGHSVSRLTDYVKGIAGQNLYTGDDEQYAAAYALMIQDLGVPARVVVGVPSLPSGGVVKGSAVAAWVEVQANDRTWLTIPTDDFINKVNNPPDKTQLKQQTQQQPPGSVPPPPQGRPKTALDDAAQSNTNSNDLTKKVDAGSGGGIPGWLVAVGTYVGLPVLGLAVLFGAIVGLKAWRRYRRRSRGSPSLRLARGWLEVTDHARDLGSSVPAKSTRREQARALGASDVGPLARLADAHVFGGGEITDDHAHSFWTEVAAVRKHMSGTVGRWRRLRAAVNITTFLPRLPGADS